MSGRSATVSEAGQGILLASDCKSDILAYSEELESPDGTPLAKIQKYININACALYINMHIYRYILTEWQQINC